MAAEDNHSSASRSRFSKKSKGGAIASKVEHQDSVGSVLALESIGGLLRDVPADIVQKQGYVACEWDQDLEIHWPTGTLFIQVKDQVLDVRDVRQICEDFGELAHHYGASRGVRHDVAYRIEALAGLSTSARSFTSDLEHLRSLPATELERDSALLVRDFASRWGVHGDLVRKLTIANRDIRRDSVGAVAIFAHLMRKIYPVHDYTDARLMDIWDVLANRFFAPARRNRSPVLLGGVEEAILKPLMPIYLLRYEVEYVRTSYGYIVDPLRRRKLEEESELGRRALKKAMQAWRRHTRKTRILNMLYRGDIKCPACNAPMIANGWGRKGTGCPHCGYSPYLTLVYVCDCEELIPLIDQPEPTGMGIFGEAVSLLRGTKISCDSCGSEPRFENLHTRLALVPFPIPVEKFSEQDLVEIRVRLGWRRWAWPFEGITPAEKMIADDEQAKVVDSVKRVNGLHAPREE